VFFAVNKKALIFQGYGTSMPSQQEQIKNYMESYGNPFFLLAAILIVLY